MAAFKRVNRKSPQGPDQRSRLTPRHRLPFWFRIELVEPGLISRYFSEAMDPGHAWKWNLQKFPSVLLCARLCAHAALIGSRSPSYPNHRGRWCATCPCKCPIAPQSTLASVADLVPTIVALFQSFLGFCLSLTDPNVAQPKSIASLHESVSTICKQFSAHVFPPVHLYQHFMRLHCSFPKFVAELDVCMLLHCAVTLPLTQTTFNWPQSVYTAGHMQSMLCVDSLHVSEEACACAKLPFRYDTIHRTF